MSPAMNGIHQPRTCVCDSAMTTSRVPRMRRYQATKMEITTSVGSGHTSATMPAAMARVPPMMATHRQPPVSTMANANDVTPPSQNATAIRITHTEIETGRSDRTMNPSSSQRIPATSHSHHELAYACRDGALVLPRTTCCACSCRCSPPCTGLARVAPAHYDRPAVGTKRCRGYPRRPCRRPGLRRSSRTGVTAVASACVSREPGVVEGGLEDDQHYFTVTLHHDDTKVQSVTSGSVRAPWSTCAAAAEPLRTLAGMPLSDRCLAVTRWTESVQHCTHQLDLAGLAVAHAARVVAGGARTRQYDAVVPFGLLDGEEHTITLDRDGERRLEWVLQGGAIVAPSPYADAPRGFAKLGRRHPRAR